MTDKKKAEEKRSEERKAEEKRAEDRKSQDQKPQGQKPQGQKPQGQNPQEQNPESPVRAGPPAHDVPLAGVPVTPPGPAPEIAGAAVPSEDYVKTEVSPNQETSGPAAENVGADAAAEKGEPVEPVEQEGVAKADQSTPAPSSPDR